MPKLVPTVSVVVIRDDKRTHPEIGKKFDFTAEEVKSINESHPGALRKPNNEDDGVAAQDGVSTATAGSNAEASQAGAKGGKKASTANRTEGAESTDGEGGGDGAGSDDDL